MICIPNTDEARKYKNLTDMIPVGKAEAVTMTDLSRLMEMTARDIRRLILKARGEAGILICSGDEGYFFPADEAELKEYTNRRKRYVRTACVALAPFRRKVKEFDSEDSNEARNNVD